MKRVMPVDPVLRVPSIAIDDKYLVERAISRFTSYESDRAEWSCNWNFWAKAVFHAVLSVFWP